LLEVASWRAVASAIHALETHEMWRGSRSRRGGPRRHRDLFKQARRRELALVAAQRLAQLARIAARDDPLLEILDQPPLGEVELSPFPLEGGDGMQIVGAVLEELDDGPSGIAALAPPGLPGQRIQLVSQLLRPTLPRASPLTLSSQAFVKHALQTRDLFPPPLAIGAEDILT
jgi:hypothetical protein